MDLSALTLLIEPDPILAARAEPWDFSVDSLEDARELAIIMQDVMDQHVGIGLAANQVGILKRIAVISVPDCAPKVLVNPVFEAASTRKVTYEEGCLSVPDRKILVSRSADIRVTHLDIMLPMPAMVKFKASDLEAVCIQHEIDHLNGVTITDREKWR